MSNFVHLHLHTEYSLLDGACRLGPLMQRVKDLGQSAVAITDHGVMYGCVDFYKAARAAGVKPIIGCEVYVANRTRHDKVKGMDGNHHLVLLCKNETGYANLAKLVSAGFVEGFYSKPRVDKALLEQYHEGLVCLSACLAGEIPQLLLAGDFDGAKKVALWYEALFGKDNYYIELQDHGLREQQQILPHLGRLAEETGVPLVATNDSHYLTKADAKMQQVLICIQTGKTIHDDDKMEFGTDEFYVKSGDEMAALFAQWPEACENTAKIAELCNFDFEFGVTKLPYFKAPDGQDNEAYFRAKCETGFAERYGDNPPPEARERLDYEIGVISKMGYTNYYLIVADFIEYARSKGIPVGPGRGSGAGSIAAYCMYITGVEPLQYGLLFERFLNPERVSMPDFDIDFCYVRRQEVIDYVINKYGEDHVAQIITFGTLAARAAIRDVGRVLDIPYQKVDAIAKMVPFALKMTLDRAMTESKALRDECANDPDIQNLIEMAMRVEGMPRHAGTHAAGVVITPQAASDYVPLSTNDGAVVTQYTMTTIEELGLLKMDFLGLRTLTVISDAQKMINTYEPDFDMDKVGFDDPEVYKLLSSGQTDGVFQLESGGMRQTLMGLKPQYFEDIIALISLYRPGPMESIPTYIHNRHNPGHVRYKTPLLEPILGVTYGCIVYQEQVMQICRELAGFSYGQADLVRRAMSKKKHDVMEKMRAEFVFGTAKSAGGAEETAASTAAPEEKGCCGCVANGVPEDVANSIFDEMSGFASYAFNKSHAAAYAVVAYQTAWLKCHYPREFMAALLTSVLDWTSKVISYIAECERLGIRVLPPDINKSAAGFTVADGHVRYGLLALKNVGHHLIDSIVKNRRENGDYLSLYDFCSRIHGTELNRRAVESLIKSGAFDNIEQNRKSMMLALEGILKSVENEKRRNLDGQIDLFGAAGEAAKNTYKMPEVEEYPKDVLLQQEKEISGMFLSGHPLEKYREVMNRVSNCNIAALVDEDSGVRDNQEVTLVCAIGKVKFYTTKSSDVMAFITIEDLTGAMEALVFPKVLMAANGVVAENAIVKIRGRISLKEEEEPKLLAEEVLGVEDTGLAKVSAAAKAETDPQKSGLYIKVPSKDSEEYRKTGNLLSIFEGDWPVYIRFADTKQMVRAPQSMWAMQNNTLIAELKSLLGEANVAVR